MTAFCKGIYYVEGKVWFPTQIVVTNELDKNSHEWLKALSGQLQKNDIWKLLEERNHLAEKADRELADSVLEVSFNANKKLIEELIGDEGMYETLMEIMEPRLRMRDKEKEEEGLKRGIQGTVDTLRDFGHKDAEIKPAIIKKYNLSSEEAENYMQKA